MPSSLCIFNLVAMTVCIPVQKIFYLQYQSSEGKVYDIAAILLSCVEMCTFKKFWPGPLICPFFLSKFKLSTTALCVHDSVLSRMPSSLCIFNLVAMTVCIPVQKKYFICMDDDKIDYHVHIEAKFNKVRGDTCRLGRHPTRAQPIGFIGLGKAAQKSPASSLVMCFLILLVRVSYQNSAGMFWVSFIV